MSSISEIEKAGVSPYVVDWWEQIRDYIGKGDTTTDCWPVRYLCGAMVLLPTPFYELRDELCLLHSIAITFEMEMKQQAVEIANAERTS